MEYQGFVGPTYRTLSPAVSMDRCVNWYPEIVPTGSAKTKINYYPTPGLVDGIRTAGRGAGIGRGMFALNGRIFCVFDDQLYELFTATMTSAVIPGEPLATDGLPVSFASNGPQLMIASSGRGYLFDGTKVSEITGGATPGEFQGSSMCAFLDGYFIALIPNSRSFQISGIGNGFNWSALDVGNNTGSPDNLVAIIVAHEYLYLFGSIRAAVYYNSGNADFPFVPISGAFIEQGCAAAGSLQRVDNTIVWLGAGENGNGILYRADGFIPKRISTHAVEQAWQSYSRIDDAVAFVSQQNGHTFYRITFPSGDATWVYDFATDMWHERASFDIASGTLHAQFQRFHCTSNGRQFVQPALGNVIRQETATAMSDVSTAGQSPIKRLRIGPVIYNANKRNFVSRLEIVVQPAIGAGNLDPAGNPNVVNPAMSLRYSGNGGGRWSNQLTSTGLPVGAYGARIAFNQLGSGRAWIPELSTTDPGFWVIVGAEIEVTQGAW